MKYATFFLFFTLSLSTNTVWGQVRNFTTHNSISDVAFQGDYVWIGSQGGLVRYDNVTKTRKSFLAGNSPIKGGGITCIENGWKGSMWFGSFNAGVFYLSNDKWKHYTYPLTFAKHTEVVDLEVEPNNVAWVVVRSLDIGSTAANRLYRIEGDVVDHITTVTGNPLEVHAGRDNILWIKTHEGIIQYSKESEQVVAEFALEGSVNRTKLAIDANGNIILATPY